MQLSDNRTICIGCGSQNSIERNDGKVQCMSCTLITINFNRRRPLPTNEPHFTPLTKNAVLEMTEDILSIFSYQHLRRRMQELIEKGEALGRLLPPITFTLMELVADNNPSEIVQSYIPFVVETFGSVIAKYGLIDSIEGIMKSIKIIQEHAKEDEHLVEKLIGIRNIFTPHARWVTEDLMSEREDETKRLREIEDLRVRNEEQKRLEILAEDNAKKSKIRAKKLALGLNPDDERLPMFIQTPPRAVVNIDGKKIFLRVQGKYIKKYQWLYNGRVITSNDLPTISGEASPLLKIGRLTRRVCGLYSCVCENEEGKKLTEVCEVLTVNISSMKLGNKKLRSIPSKIVSCENGYVGVSLSNSLHLFDSKTLFPVECAEPIPAECIAYDSHKKILVTGNSHGELVFYSLSFDLRGTSHFVHHTRKLKYHTKFAIKDVHLIRNGSLVWISSYNQQICLYCVADFGVLKEWQAPHDIIYSCSSDRQILVLFQTKNYLELYDVDTGMKRDLKIRNHASVAAYSRYGFHLAVGEYSCTKGWINLINPATAKSYKHFEAHVGRLSGIAWSSLDFMISSGSDGYIKVWDSRDGACLFLSNLDSHGLWTLHFNCSSMLAYVATSNGCLECWEITNIKGLEDSTEMELNVAATQLQRIYKGKKTREIMRIFRSNQNE